MVVWKIRIPLSSVYLRQHQYLAIYCHRPPGGNKNYHLRDVDTLLYISTVKVMYYKQPSKVLITKDLQVSYQCWIKREVSYQSLNKSLTRGLLRVSLRVQGGPARGGPMSPVWILKRLVSVLINACRLLSALPSLSQFGPGRLSVVAISFYALSLVGIYPGRPSTRRSLRRAGSKCLRGVIITFLFTFTFSHLEIIVESLKIDDNILIESADSVTSEPFLGDFFLSFWHHFQCG